ncbi:hypothetical protein M2271_007221 [Streptomyces sp. LBL]|uniref:hypothetical protein n=1 Tax=Streptomyces sp. LBL TaxID=2940562 RepID=UPI0024738E61|nr:hypothetical protein [Streptomyces sp. LBL]MDH6629385.1 hypothetical protein [Streptomyces sp. LBL]
MSLSTTAPTVTIPGAFGETFTVTPGRIDDAALRAFRSGQCHALARAVSDTTGWPMALIIDAECAYDPDLCADDDIAEGLCTCQLRHIVVVRPDGQHVDITGAHAPGTVPGYEGAPATPLTEDLWQHLLNSADWRTPALHVARTFVAPLIASLP